jgi:hypothetical protein
MFTCRISNSCEVTFTTRRRCSACRLKKCFQQGMKKEFIRSVSSINHATSVSAMNSSQYHSSIPTNVSRLIIKFPF